MKVTSYRFLALGLPMILVLTLLSQTEDQRLPVPDGFVDLKEAIPSLLIELRYNGEDNFLGRRVQGYEAPRALATKEAAEALAKVQGSLKSAGLGIKVFDAYRPQRAVAQFVRWTEDPKDLIGKERYYPNVQKSQLIPLGYIAKKSGHSRGSAVDVTLIALADQTELDMGSPFDLFDPKSHSQRAGLTPTQEGNRRKLREAMVKHGFKPLKEEWWHFSLVKEPYPKTYFDFAIR